MVRRERIGSMISDITVKINQSAKATVYENGGIVISQARAGSGAGYVSLTKQEWDNLVSDYTMAADWMKTQEEEDEDQTERDS